MAMGLALALPASTALAGNGGSSAMPVPKLSGASCRSDCAGTRSARPGSVVRVSGRDLDTVDTVVLLGKRGPRDDVEVSPLARKASYVDVKVPRTARSGRVAVVNLDGAQSRSPKSTTLEIGAAAPEQMSTMRGGGGSIEVEMQGKRVFYDAHRKATMVYVVAGSAPAAVQVELIRVEDGTSIAMWDQGTVEPGTPQTVKWNGKAGGAVQRDGTYEFRVFAQSSDGVRAQSAQAGEDGPGAFTFLRHKFPVRGAHDYGEFAASFGGGRGHQGHDVFAKCGTPLVAARGGVVKHRASHGAAGNYVVIDGQSTGTDYVYMHLRDPAVVKLRDRVRTGQLIGYVGDTGRAHGCHLHFELWDAPGWYTGGSPFDPLPLLKGWDANS